jgi:hypothetical protein
MRFNVRLSDLDDGGEVYVETEDYIYAEQPEVNDPLAATRRAIVRAAAGIEKARAAMSDKLTEMWERLERHQPFADQRGYGDAWRVMCTERTPEAAREAEASAAEARAAAAARDAAEEAEEAAWASDAAWAAAAAVEAIRNVNKAEEPKP